MPVPASRSVAVERTWPTITLTDRLPVVSRTWSRSRRHAARARAPPSTALRVLERRRRTRAGRGEVAHRLGDLRRDVLVEPDRPDRAARQHADVAHREVDPDRGGRVVLDAAAEAPPRRRVQRGLPPGRTRRRRAARSAHRSRARARGPRRRACARGRRSPRRRRRASPPARRARGRAARRIVATGSAGRTSAFTSSAIAPPASASRKRANVTPWVGGWIVATSAADTAAWLAISWPLPRKIASSIASITTSASWPGADADLEHQQVADRDPDGDADRDLGGAAAALRGRQAERDDRRDRARRTAACARTPRWRRSTRARRRPRPARSTARTAAAGRAGSASRPATARPPLR